MLTMYDYKRYANITDSEQDSKIAASVSAAKAVAEKYTGLSFDNGTKTVKLNPPATDYLILPDTNAASITSVVLVGVGDWDDTLEVYSDVTLEDSEYYLDYAGVLELDVSDGTTMPTGKRTITVKYEIDNTIPSDLKLAVYELTHYYFKREYYYSKTVGSETIDFSDDNILPAQVKTILDMHRCL